MSAQPRRALLAGVVSAALIVVACSGATRPSVVPVASPASTDASAAPIAVPSSTVPVATPGATGRVAGSTATPGTSSAAVVEPLTADYASATFSRPTRITNEWLPYTPGTRWKWVGSAVVDGKRLPREVVLTISDLTKVVDGVRVVVAYELDYTDHQLEEAEIALWAQADDGTVWHFGQYPEVLEDGVVTQTPIWIHGVAGAKAGISMKPDPQPYTASYSQGWGPAVGWADRGRVFEMGSETCVKLACYRDVLVIDEFNRDEPDAHQLKYYARGIGNVRVGWAGALEEEQEVLELVSLERLSRAELATIDASVLQQDARGYRVSPEVYGHTSPAS
jgi:hypothetical protein